MFWRGQDLNFTPYLQAFLSLAQAEEKKAT